jgi:hypothetical protein
MDTNQETTKVTNGMAAAVDVVSAEPALTPEAVVDVLRSTRARITEMAPMTPKERRLLRRRADTPGPIVQASIDVLGALENVSQAVGQPAADVRQLSDDVNRWRIVEGELRSMLNGIAGANLIRRQRIALIAGQAFNIGAQLARDPANAVLKPHLDEVKRLKSFKRRKKAAPPAPGTPLPKSPSTPVTPVVPFERSDM